ncbi:MAG: hypothetical protein R3344_12035, partial [Acidobacteriota bacterium]|nr:hypothetical protein [Acidobacteriota bacterium]
EAYVGDLTTYRVLAVEAALAVEEWITDPLVITIEGPSNDPRVNALRRAALNQPVPWTLLRPATDVATVGARLSWGGSETRVTRPEDLASEALGIRSAEGDGTR